ncbi:lysozyme inhibitor LprI family protein [Sphingopyxis sp. 550A]
MTAAPAAAQSAPPVSVPASFDCGKATRAVDRFICANAALRWQDLALSRSYRAVLDKLSGSARAALVAEQRDWVSERDRRCAADRSFAELNDPASSVHDQAYDCMIIVYQGRRQTLGDRAAAPIATRVIGEIDLGPIARARPELAEKGRVPVAGMRLSPDGRHVAILLPSRELDGPDQLWLFRVADRKLTAVTPRPDTRAQHPADALTAITGLAWRGDTLFAIASLWGDGSDGESGPTAYYAATVAGSRRLPDRPPEAADRWESVTGGLVYREDEFSDDLDAVESLRGNEGWLVWAADRGHGTVDLHIRARKPLGTPYLVAWGGWELASFLFDDARSRLNYPADVGIMRFDMATRAERRIAGTWRGDRPYAVSADQGTLLWVTRNACGDEHEADPDAPERFCLAAMTNGA